MSIADRPVYPLKFEPIYKEKVWGGRTLGRLGRDLPGDDATLIGESWELADLGETSVSGGGGSAERSVITNGPWAGSAFHDVLGACGGSLLGRLPLTESGDFPLLVKFLDARQNLSVQVHPSAAYAAAHGDAHLKSEAWYVVHADPGAVIYKGMRDGVTAEQFRAAIESGVQNHVTSLLIEVPVKAGDCHYLPSGTCHALGAGVLVAEVQTPSDTTFRVYDWGRASGTGRELHLEQAMQCIHFGKPDVAANEKRSHIGGVFTTVSRLILCEYFRIEKVRMTETYEQEIPYDQPVIWMVLQGAGSITGKDFDPVEFCIGQTLYLPANMTEPRIRLDEDTVWLEIAFPQSLNQELA